MKRAKEHRSGNAAKTAVTLLALGLGSAVCGAVFIGPRLGDQLERDARAPRAEQHASSQAPEPVEPEPEIHTRPVEREAPREEADPEVKIDVRDAANPKGEDPAPLGEGGEADGASLLEVKAAGERPEDSDRATRTGEGDAPGEESGPKPQPEPERQSPKRVRREDREPSPREEERPRESRRSVRAERRDESGEEPETRRERKEREASRPKRDEERPKEEPRSKRERRQAEGVSPNPDRDRSEPKRAERGEKADKPESSLKSALDAAARAERRDREPAKPTESSDKPERKRQVRVASAGKPEAPKTEAGKPETRTDSPKSDTKKPERKRTEEAPAAEEKEEAQVFAVRVGRFKTKDAAHKFQEAVSAATGDSGYLIQVPGGYRLQMGVYRQRANADKVADRLREHDLAPEVTEEKRAVRKAPTDDR